jgi:hypothetical protein
MSSADGRLHVHKFIKTMKQTELLNECMHFSEVTSNKVEIDSSMSVIPETGTDEKKFIHGIIFEYAVHCAFTKDRWENNNVWKKFTVLYPNMEQKKKKQYQTFMYKAGRVAWDIFYTNVKTVYGRKEKSIRPLFEHTILNKNLPILTKTLVADIFVSSLPNIVCEIKYSTMDKARYEQEYLVHAIIQVLIYSLALHLEPSTLHLQILVFFSRTAEVVLYESNVHNNETLVNRLLNQLGGTNEVAEESDVRKGKNPKESEKAFTAGKDKNLTTPEEELDVIDHE